MTTEKPTEKPTTPAPAAPASPRLTWEELEPLLRKPGRFEFIEIKRRNGPLSEYVVELLVVRSYAAAVVVITPLALTIAASGHSADVRVLVVDRALDTVLGVLVALVVLWASGWGTPVPILRAQARRVVAAMERMGGWR